MKMCSLRQNQKGPWNVKSESERHGDLMHLGLATTFALGILFELKLHWNPMEKSDFSPPINILDIL